jgi:hypothetical protein
LAADNPGEALKTFLAVLDHSDAAGAAVHQKALAAARLRHFPLGQGQNLWTARCGRIDEPHAIGYRHAHTSVTSVLDGPALLQTNRNKEARHAKARRLSN